MLDSPGNLRHPTTWHARGYSLNAANPFATRSFTGDNTLDGSHTIAAGDSIVFKYRVVIYESPSVDIEDLYEQYVRSPGDD